MAPLNIGQIGGMLRNLGGRAAQDLVDDITAPAIRSVVSINNVTAPLMRSIGSIPDQVTRPISRFGQRIANERARGNLVPNWGGKKLVAEATGRTTPMLRYTQAPYQEPAQRFAQEFGARTTPGIAASLRPGPTAGSNPFNDPLNLLQGRGQYLQRQVQEGIQAGVDTSKGVFRKLQSVGPTALNPLATRNPTTLLGKAGQLFNPLNPRNLAGYLAEPIISSVVPESMRGTVRAGLYTPGGIPGKILGGSLYDMFLNQSNAGVGLSAGTLQDNDPIAYARLQQLSTDKNNKAQNNQPQISNGFSGAGAGSTPGSMLTPPGSMLNAPGPRLNSPDNGPQERARQAEIASVAQQTAQNPLFKKYQVAELTKQYNTAKNPAEKEQIGLQIWAQTNPDLAWKLKSGQVGYEESRTAPGISNAGGLPIGSLPMPSTGFNVTTAISTLGAPEQVYGTPVPSFSAAATPMAYNPGVLQSPVTDGAIQASYGQQPQATPDFAKALMNKAFLQRVYREQGLK